MLQVHPWMQAMVAEADANWVDLMGSVRNYTPRYLIAVVYQVLYCHIHQVLYCSTAHYSAVCGAPGQPFWSRKKVQQPSMS